jgi:hypothetical protein
MTTWYQVTIYPRSFGFAVKDRIVVSHPDNLWLYSTLEEYKKELIKQKAIVSKIC